MNDLDESWVILSADYIAVWQKQGSESRQKRKYLPDHRYSMLVTDVFFPAPRSARTFTAVLGTSSIHGSMANLLPWRRNQSLKAPHLVTHSWGGYVQSCSFVSVSSSRAAVDSCEGCLLHMRVSVKGASQDRKSSFSSAMHCGRGLCLLGGRGFLSQSSQRHPKA